MLEYELYLRVQIPFWICNENVHANLLVTKPQLACFYWSTASLISALCPLMSETKLGKKVKLSQDCPLS